MLSLIQIQRIVPAASQERLELLLPYLDVYMPAYDISKPLRVAAFIAEVAHESGSFSRLEENLRYSAQRLTEVFPRLFPNYITTQPYAGNPEKLGNYVYANKGGNGDVKSGDGYKFRGRGLIQVTLKDNYLNLSKALFNSDRLLKNPELIAQPAYAVESACWYWKYKNINELADKGDLIGVTRKINPALLEYDKRLKFYNQAKKVLNIK